MPIPALLNFSSYSFASVNRGTVLGGDFNDDFSTNIGWTQVGTGITVNSGSLGKLASVGFESTTARVYKSLGLTLSDTLWTAKFEAKITNAAYSSDSENEFTFFFASNTTYRTYGANIDLIGVLLGQNNFCHSEYKDGTGAWVRSSPITGLTTGTLFYFTLQRTSATNVRLNIYSDAARTTHVSGSPVDFSIPSTVQSLQYVSASTSNNYGGVSDVEIDNLEVFNNT